MASASPVGPKQTIRYCSSTISVWDAPYCVKEVTPEQQRRRDWTRRLTYQDGRVVRLEDVNGRGQLYYDEDDVYNTTEYLYQDEKVIGSVGRDVWGIVRRRNLVGSDRAFHHSYDAWRRPVQSAKTRWVSLKRVFNEQGRIVSHTYLDRQGRPVPNKHGVCRMDFVYDAGGSVLEERYYDDLGQPMLNDDGVHRIAYVPDGWGSHAEARYFGVRGEPVLNRHGVHLIRFGRNDVGQSISAARFGLKDEPVIDKQIGASVWHGERNEHGEIVKNSYHDGSGAPTINGWNYFINRESYDARGRRTQRAFFGLHDEPTGVSGQVHVWRWNYDSKGLPLGGDYFDSAGRPTRSWQNAGYRFAYDRRFNLIREEGVDVDGKPGPLDYGFVRREHVYDEYDQRVRSATMNAEGEPAKSYEGFAVVTTNYAADGSVVSRTYLDDDGNEVPRWRLAIVRVNFAANRALIGLPKPVEREVEARLAGGTRPRAEAERRAKLAREALEQARPAEIVVTQYGDAGGGHPQSKVDLVTLTQLPEELTDAVSERAVGDVSELLEHDDAFWVIRRDAEW